MRAAPSRTTGCRTSQRRNRRFVTRPRTTMSSSAAVSRASASSRFVPQAMILASIGSNRPPTSVPTSIPASMRTSSRAGQRSASTRPIAGRNPSSASSAYRRTSIAWPEGRMSADSMPSGSPAAIRSWSATRSRPVTSSVTGCSTWSRVFISMKVGSPRSSIRNSQVPAFTYPTARRERQRGVAETAPKSVLDARRRALLEDLLVATLDRAVALAEMDAGAVGIEEHLHLDMAGALDEPLEDHPVVRERRASLATGRGQARPGRRARSRTTRIPLPPPPAAGLIRSGMPIFLAALVRRSSDWSSSSYPASTGIPSDTASRRAAALSPIVRMASGGGPTQRRPAAMTRSAKSAFSARNPKPGWTASDAASDRRSHDGLGVEEVEGVASVRLGHDDTNAQPVAGALDAARDLASIGDEQRVDRRRRGSDRLVGRVERVKRDTPTAPNASCRQHTTLDPPLDRAR